MGRAAEDEGGGRGTRRRVDGDRRRAQLLDAALRCFDRAGVLGAGIEDVRREAGASPSSVYHLFGGIDGVLLALLERIFTALFAHLDTRVRRTRSAGGAIRALVEAHIEWIAAHPVEGRVMYQAMTLEVGGLDATSRQRLADHKAAALGGVVAHIGRFVAAGELPAWSPGMFDIVVLGPSHEALRRWLAGAEEFHPDHLRRILPDLAWRTVRPARR